MTLKNDNAAPKACITNYDYELTIIEPNNENNLKENFISKESFNYTLKHTLRDMNINSLKEPLYNFLKEIQMEKFTDTFYNEGFDDINLILKQMKSGYGITEENLKEIGIQRPGDRAKILIRLQELSDFFNFDIEFDAVYHINTKEFSKVKFDFYLPKFKKFLKQISMENYLKNFYENGYFSLELIYVQMHSMYPFSEIILEDIGIDKLGHRNRIISQLKQTCPQYIQQMVLQKQNRQSPKIKDNKLCAII